MDEPADQRPDTPGDAATAPDAGLDEAAHAAVDRPDDREAAVDQPDVDQPESDAPGVDHLEADQPGTDGSDVEEPEVGNADPTTSHPAVDEVLRSLAHLEEQPVEEHVEAFERAHEELRRALADAHDPGE